ncbi:hypothetical protein [Parapedobacter sp. 10938]|uniref:hypothetical protein n=1 Tax=Parapedobacter flavus TaxID=3110225 RepID=UPI002DBD2256|nr:hypothetical protein [Parapedobacter sp. 10938]MEC3880087.1 hypothetical protein [Parapedobacter sp. 10938]
MKRHSTPYAFSMLVAVLTFALSCKKSSPPEPGVQFPLTVKATAILSQGPVRLFTHEGEVTDAAVIAQFISGADGFNKDFEIEAEDVITFQTDSTLEFESLTGLISVQAETADKLVFRYPFAPTLNDSYNSILQPLLDHQRIAKTNITHMVPTGTGFRYVGEVVIVASGNYQAFELPVTVYLLSRWRGQGEFAKSYYSNSGVFSPFSDDFLATLGARDTVAYQENVTLFSE